MNKKKKPRRQKGAAMKTSAKDRSEVENINNNLLWQNEKFLFGELTWMMLQNKRREKVLREVAREQNKDKNIE